MRRLFFIVVMMVLLTSVSAQEKTRQLEGTVTYFTAQHVYVRFISAKSIKPGDMIYHYKDSVLVPLLSVENCSSISCVGKRIGQEAIKVGDKVIALVPQGKESEEKSSGQPQHTNNLPSALTSATTDTVHRAVTPKQEIKGRLYISSYSNFSSTAASEDHRLRYTFLMDVANIADSRFSFESYVSFAHNLNNWGPIKNNIFNGLKIYNLNGKVRLDKNMNLIIGRRINPNISSLGAIDGLQAESDNKHFFWGAVVGFRPDYTDYGFNAHLLEYGGYGGFAAQNKNGRMRTTFALFEQTNAGKTDRRFAYFQHDNALIKNVNLFFSSELDLYKVVNDKPTSDLILTSLYLSVNYRPFKKLSLSGSYDNRKNVIYYQTFKSYLNQLIENATRQGLQFRINYRPVNLMTMGLTSNYRDFSSDVKPTKNTYGFLSFNQLPLLKVSATLSSTILQTSYIQGSIYGIRLDKNLLSGKLNTSIGYQKVDFQYQANAVDLKQQIGQFEFMYQISRKFSVSANYEGTFDKQTHYHNIYFSAIQRF
ncbi:MAG: hypothetical protein ACM3O8_06660 [Methylococcaceae bacterium]